MCGRKGATWVLAASAFWLCACGTVNKPERDAAPAGLRRITLQVPGMVDRQGIT
jgi:hypothetical protein